MHEKPRQGLLDVIAFRPFGTFGAVLAMLVLGCFITDTLFGMVFSAVAGVMIYISMDELLPAAREYGEHYLTIVGFVLGMGVMAAGVLMLFHG